MEARPMDSILEKVAQICPAAVQDNKIDFERLKLELAPELNEDAESYNFTWVGKKDAIMGASTPIRKTLRPCKEESKNWDTTKNLYIEGDNLDVLKLLQESYLGKVKMIYIDPPYNTGNDFVYCDDFADSCEEYMEKKGQCDVETNERLFKNDESNGRFHSNWCTMMYPRLKIARDLLSDDGVIFMSIDDHEQANLKKICDEIFGEGNFVATLKWKKKKQPSFLSKVADVIEYIHIYSKNYNAIGQLCAENLSDSDKPVVNASNKPCERIIRQGTRVKADVSFIPKGVVQNKTAETEYLDDVSIINGRTANDVRIIAKFRTTQDGIDDFCKKDLLFITKNLGLRRDLSEDEKGQGKAITDLVLDWGQNQDATNELKKLFSLTGDGTVFSNPKPVSLLMNLIKTSSDSTSIVLDFFSGSATTANAVMQLNADDDNNRKFIMVQLPENLDENLKHATGPEKTTIQNAIALCDELSVPHKLTEVAKERIRRAGDKIVAETGKKDLDIGFKVLKLDETNMKDVYYNPAETSQSGLLDSVDNIKSDRSDLDLLYGVMIDLGLQLDLDVSEIKSGNTTYYNVDDGSMVACFAQNIPDSIIKEIAELKPLKVVFRDSSFADAPAKINVTEIFKTISPNTKITVL